MRFKHLMTATVICFSSFARAAFTVCQYEVQPCDQFGNHYYCTVIGWTGPNPPEYCAPKGASSGPGKSDKESPPEIPEIDDPSTFPVVVHQ